MHKSTLPPPPKNKQKRLKNRMQVKSFEFKDARNPSSTNMKDVKTDFLDGKFPLVSMEGRVKGLACSNLGAMTPISANRNFNFLTFCTINHLILRSK